MSDPVHPEYNPSSGFGDWKNFQIPMERVMEAAAEWQKKIAGVEKPWLCWNVSHRWSQLQQRLVKHVGWTPVVGFDPAMGAPPLEPGSILIDFNAHFGLPRLAPHFPLEFVFLWADKLAFWHSDLLCRLPVMQGLAEKFEALQNSEMSAVFDYGGKRNLLNFKRHRFFELVGCTTRGASESQFYNGCGWFRNIYFHPKCPVSDRQRRRWVHPDHGGGILYWKKRYHGTVHSIPLRLVDEGHCTEWNVRSAVNRPKKFETSETSSDRFMLANQFKNLTARLDQYYSIDEVAARLGIAHLA